VLLVTGAGAEKGEPIDATYLFLGTVAAPIVVVQLARVLPWSPRASLLLAAVAGVAALVAEGRYRGHGDAVIAVTAACAVVLGLVWTFVLAITGLLLQGASP
jgi:hypothetical protein